MSTIICRQLLPCLYWVEVPEIGLRLQCGCPPDANKYLRAEGLIAAGTHGETGPNAILLADVNQTSQKDWQLVNAAEFSVMQMLYLQGLIIPNHPNNTGRKPLLIGEPAELERQLQYIYCGNYGLDSIEQLRSAGMSEEEAEAFWFVKQKFAFGALHPITNLIEPVPLPDNRPALLPGGCLIERLQANTFRIRYGESAAEIRLQNSIVPPSYRLPNIAMPEKNSFGILHLGEGDGWDQTRPCMATALQFQNDYYLVDAGPHIWHNWQKTERSPQSVRAVFLTHAHDDHAIGLLQGLGQGIRPTVYCGSVVQAAFAKKMGALMGLPPAEVAKLFNFRTLHMQTWNRIADSQGETLEAMPCYSLHPIETHIYYFRYTDAAGQQTLYGHLADIISEQAMQAMQADAPDRIQWLFDLIRRNYYLPAHVKKIDIGGGATHGMAQDFRLDPTPVKVFAHIHRPLTAEEMQIGTTRNFGQWD